MAERLAAIFLSSMNSDLPTARSYLKSNVRLVIWCKSCRHRREIGFQTIIYQGKAMCRSCI